VCRITKGSDHPSFRENNPRSICNCTHFLKEKKANFFYFGETQNAFARQQLQYTAKRPFSLLATLSAQLLFRDNPVSSLTVNCKHNCRTNRTDQPKPPEKLKTNPNKTATMCLIFTCGEHTFRKEVEGYEGITCQCHNCGNYSGKVIKSNPWFTFCFVVGFFFFFFRLRFPNQESARD
jgi:hypothetical protein